MIPKERRHPEHTLPDTANASHPAQLVSPPSSPPAQSSTEVEIKLRPPHLADTLQRAQQLGFRVITPRALERNTLFDTPDQSLRRAGHLLRLRDYAGAHVLTFKGAAQPGKHKVREELETTVGDPVVFQLLLARLGLQPGFRYEKYRTVYAQPDAAGHLTVDETPIGPFLELEGPPTWIDHTAAALGFLPHHYITASYGQLWAEHCAATGRPLGDFVFPESPAASSATDQ